MSSFIGSLPKDKLSKAVAEDEFVKSVNDGQCTSEQFYTWVAQDYLFGIAHFRLVCKTLIASPRSDYANVIETLAELEEELTWTEKKLRAKGIVVKDITVSEDNREYLEWFEETIKSNASFLPLMAAMYAYDVCCYEKWKSVKSRDYKDFVSRMGDKEFGQGLEELKSVIDKIAVNASESDKEEARKMWDTVIEFESAA